MQVGNNDEYQRSITAPAPGAYLYTYRFNLFPGNAANNFGWTLADLDGAGSNPGLSYNPNNLLNPDTPDNFPVSITLLQ